MIYMFLDKWFANNKRSFFITLAFLVLSAILIITMFWRNSITIKIDQLALFENPSAAAKEVDIAKKGTRLSIVNEKHGWYQLRREDNEETGWVPSWIVNDQDKFQDKKVTRLSQATIVLDAGHGGSDPGSIAVVGRDKDPDYQEKTYTLKMINAIKRELEKTGARVILTRTDDTFINIHQIPELAIKNSADAFISVHFDSTEPQAPIKKPKSSSSQNSSTSQIEGALQSADIAPADDAVTSEATEEQESESSDSSNSSEISSEEEEEEYIPVIPASGFETFYYHDNGSRELSDALCDALDGIGLSNRGSNEAEYVVIKENSRPATLLELGFINNGSDFELIQSDKFRNDVAKKIRKGLTNYFDNVAPKLNYSAVQNSK